LPLGKLNQGSNVAIQGVASTPDPLIRDFCEYVHARNLKNIHIYTTLPFGEGLFLQEPYASHFKTTFFFLGSIGRKEVNSGKADYTPMFLNDVPRFYRRRLIELDMCIINVSPCDAHGNYSMGPSIKTVLGAVETAKCLIGSVGRKEVNSGKADYTPMFLNDVPRFYRRRLIELDMCIINVSPCDAHGNYSMGPSIKTVLGAVETAKCLIGQINPLTPFTYGDSLVHESRFQYLVPHSMPMHTLPLPTAGVEEATIGKLIAENLVADGSTLQMGIGSIPDIVLSLLHSHKDLGIHTEMFSDGIIDLCESGVITNAHKKLYQGFIVSSFILGSERVFSFVDKNSNLGKFAH
uniref:AcetylCoA_hydro domain-containing protein n=1 Tax=Schistocephalus solidus TaxID=70667 RepID=A0A183TSC7_SCHSO